MNNNLNNLINLINLINNVFFSHSLQNGKYFHEISKSSKRHEQIIKIKNKNILFL